MNKKAIITILLALVAMTGLAQKTVVWEKPSAFMEAGSTTLDITKVELKQTETVLHLIVNFRPGLWIRFAKESFLQTPDGKKYSITGGAKTNEKESDLQPDSLFWIPESGMAHLALHFKPVPLDTKEMDFLEGYNDGDFKFWNICDSKNKKEVAIPDEWKNVQYAYDETLPVAKINKSVATIKVKMLGYKPGMNMDFYVGGFRPLGSKDDCSKEFRFADDGTLKAEIPLWLAREVTVGVEGMSFPKIVIAPGQETSILMKVTSDHRPFVAFKGYLAKTNMDLVNAYDTFEPNSDDDKTYLKVRECKTSEERLQCLKDIFNQRVADAKAAKYTTAAQDLINMDAERKFGRWLRTFAITYSQYGVSENGTVYHTQRTCTHLLLTIKPGTKKTPCRKGRRFSLFIDLFCVFSAAAFKAFQQALIQIGQSKAQQNTAADIREPVHSGNDPSHNKDHQQCVEHIDDDLFGLSFRQPAAHLYDGRCKHNDCQHRMG